MRAGKHEQEKSGRQAEYSKGEQPVVIAPDAKRYGGGLRGFMMAPDEF